MAAYKCLYFSQKRTTRSNQKFGEPLWDSPSTPPGGVLPYKGLMGTCSQPGYVFRDFCLKQGIDLSIFVLNRISVLNRVSKNRDSVLNRVGKSAIFVLNRVKVCGAAPHLPTQGYIEYPPLPLGLKPTIRTL